MEPAAAAVAVPEEVDSAAAAEAEAAEAEAAAGGHVVAESSPVNLFDSLGDGCGLLLAAAFIGLGEEERDLPAAPLHFGLSSGPLPASWRRRCE